MKRRRSDSVHKLRWNEYGKLCLNPTYESNKAFEITNITLVHYIYIYVNYIKDMIFYASGEVTTRELIKTGLHIRCRKWDNIKSGFL